MGTLLLAPNRHGQLSCRVGLRCASLRVARATDRDDLPSDLLVDFNLQENVFSDCLVSSSTVNASRDGNSFLLLRCCLATYLFRQIVVHRVVPDDFWSLSQSHGLRN